VLTIDDGWHGIHEHAWPVLRELGLPATVYVSSLLTRIPASGRQWLMRYLVWRSPPRGSIRRDRNPRRRRIRVRTGRRDRLADLLSRHADEELPTAERLGFIQSVAARLAVDAGPCSRAGRFT
jgi:hypothetical protein